MVTPSPTWPNVPAGKRPWCHPLVTSVFSPLFSFCAVGFTFICKVKLNLLLDIILLKAEVTTMDFDHFQPFLLGLRGQCTPLSLHRDPQTWSWVHPWNRSCVIQVYVQLNRSLMGPERSKKGDFAIFWPFFAIKGWIVNPHGPSSCFALLSLTATLLVTNSRKV